jgi:hypothetical protein
MKVLMLSGLAVFSTLKHVAKCRNTITLFTGYPCEICPHFRALLGKTVQLLQWKITKIVKEKYFCVGTEQY